MIPAPDPQDPQSSKAFVGKGKYRKQYRFSPYSRDHLSAGAKPVGAVNNQTLVPPAAIQIVNSLSKNSPVTRNEVVALNNKIDVLMVQNQQITDLMLSMSATSATPASRPTSSATTPCAATPSVPTSAASRAPPVGAPPAPSPQVNVARRVVLGSEVNEEEIVILLYRCNSAQELCNLPGPACFKLSEDRGSLLCSCCEDLRGWKLPDPKINGKRTAKWSKLLFNLKLHLSNKKKLKHDEKWRRLKNVRENQRKLADLVSFNLTRIAYNLIMEGQSFRSFEKHVLSAKETGTEVGDINHSKEFPPKVVDTAHKLLSAKLVDYFMDSSEGFQLPFSLIVDKDQSKLRKRTVAAIKVVNMFPDTKEKLTEILYIGHPAAIDQSGRGIAEVVTQCLINQGIPLARLTRSFRGVAVDGGVLNVNLTKWLIQRFLNISEPELTADPTLLDEPVSKTVNVWDGAHIVELVLKHALEKFASLKAAKDIIGSLSLFFRDPTIYEILRRKGLDSDQRLYTPKKERSMKFVAHDATICRDVIANRPLYVETLEAVISDNDLSDEKRAGANGFLKYMADDEFIANLTFLAGVTRLLKRFSTEFQKSGLNVGEYPNLVKQLQLALGNVKLEAPDAATGYFFEEYVEAINAAVLVDPLERSSRSRPTVGVGVVQRKQQALLRLRGVHVCFLKELEDQAQMYWFNHQYWTRDRGNTERLTNIGGFLNHLTHVLGLSVLDPVKPSHLRCTGCQQLVPVKEKRHGCTESQSEISSLAGTFTPTKTFDRVNLSQLVDRPEDVNMTNTILLEQLLKANKTSGKVKDWGAPESLEGHLKYLLLHDGGTIPAGMKQLILVVVGIACSEGIAETFGSVMETYHDRRYQNSGQGNDDLRMQREVFIRLNGPPVGDCVAFCRRVASLLNVGPTAAYHRLPALQRQFKTSVVIKRLKKETSSFFKF